MRTYQNLVFTDTFLESYASKEFSQAERAQFRKALRLLDENEQHPSLRVHALHGDLAGWWSASASDELRPNLWWAQGPAPVQPSLPLGPFDEGARPRSLRAEGYHVLLTAQERDEVAA